VCPAKVTLPSGRVLPGDRRSKLGELLDRRRLPASRLKELKTDLGSFGYAGQMQQRPAPAEGGMFKRGWWQRWTPESLPPGWQQVVASWDLAFKDTAGSSFVVGQVWGINGADRYLLGQLRGRFDFIKTGQAIMAVAAWRPDATARLVEDKANGPAIIASLKRTVGGLIPIQPDGSKEARAAAVTPLVEAGNVFLPAAGFIPCPAGYEATSVDDFIEEHASFPAGAHNDMVDATSQALKWLAVRGFRGAKSWNYMPVDASERRFSRGGMVLQGEQFLDLDESGRLVAPAGFEEITSGHSGQY
jgi:predicted phage terminase large subunit-like protein